MWRCCFPIPLVHIRRNYTWYLQNIRPFDNIVKMLSNWGINNNNIEIMNVTANQAKNQPNCMHNISSSFDILANTLNFN